MAPGLEHTAMMFLTLDSSKGSSGSQEPIPPSAWRALSMWIVEKMKGRDADAARTSHASSSAKSWSRIKRVAPSGLVRLGVS